MKTLRIFSFAKKRVILTIAWIFLLIAVFAMIMFPIGLGIIRFSIAVGCIILLISGLYLFWKNYLMRGTLLIICLISVLIFLIPGSDLDAELVQKEYVESLTSYNGVRYIWGGENKLGIDCSGLVREGYVEANIKVGIKTLNPSLIRRAFFIWWNDCAADALGNEYKGLTKLVLEAESMDKLDYSKMKPGDIIVAEEGFHTFAYIGNQIWIEADPAKGKVVKISGQDKAKEWVGVPIKLVRWNNLN